MGGENTKRITMNFEDYCAQCEFKRETETTCIQCITETMKNYTDDGADEVNVEFPTRFKNDGSHGVFTAGAKA